MVIGKSDLQMGAIAKKEIAGRPPVTAAEKRLGLALIGVLLIIAGGIWMAQSRFDRLPGGSSRKI
jgi:hypothetical protein